MDITHLTHNGRSEHVIMHRMPRFDGEHSDIGSVSGMSALQDDRTDEEYAKLLATLERKHAWRRTNLKVVSGVIRMRLGAERALCAAMNSLEKPEEDDASSIAPSSAEEDEEAERDRLQHKDLIEFIAGGTLIDIEGRIKRLEEMNTRITDLENEISQQTKALPKLCKDIAKRDQKLRSCLDKIRRKSLEIREDFRNCKEKDRLRKRIEALKLEGKYFEVNQLERTNCDRKQTVANMLPELEKRELLLKELICGSAASLRAQADAYDVAKPNLVIPDPPIVTRHVYTSDFLENGHPKGEPHIAVTGSDLASSEESEITSSIWESTTDASRGPPPPPHGGVDNGGGGCMGVGLVDAETASVTGSEMSSIGAAMGENQSHNMQKQSQRQQGYESNTSMSPSKHSLRKGRLRGIGIRKRRAFASHGHADARALMRAANNGGRRSSSNGPQMAITHTTHNENDPTAMNQAPPTLQPVTPSRGSGLPQNGNGSGSGRGVPPTTPSHTRSARISRGGHPATPSSQHRRPRERERQIEREDDIVEESEMEMESEMMEEERDVGAEEHEEIGDEKGVNSLADQVANNLSLHEHHGDADAHDHQQEDDDGYHNHTPSRSHSRSQSHSHSHAYDDDDDDALSPVQEQGNYHRGVPRR